MNLLKNPAWISDFLYPVEKYENIESSVFGAINKDLDKLNTKQPLVSVVVIAWNEEANILRCIASLSKMITQIPFEIIVVNNNSTDKTQQILDRLHLKSFTEAIQGAGPARQKGQENATGKYILTADADCLYPNCWINEMMKVLQKKGVACVYGRYSFMSKSGYPRWKLSIYERLKDVMAEIRHLKQPYFNTFGISMGYVKEYGLKVGYIKVNRRGEDGQLCLDLMKFGKIKQVRSNRARVWTGVRTLQHEGSFYHVVMFRIKEELKYFKYNFIKRS